MQCVIGCSMVYDGSLLQCLRLHSSSKLERSSSNKMEQGAACSIEASEIYEDCFQECYGGQDLLEGWTPEKEAGSYDMSRSSAEAFAVPKQSIYIYNVNTR